MEMPDADGRPWSAVEKDPPHPTSCAAEWGESRTAGSLGGKRSEEGREGEEVCRVVSSGLVPLRGSSRRNVAAGARCCPARSISKSPCVCVCVCLRSSLKHRISPTLRMCAVF